MSHEEIATKLKEFKSAVLSFDDNSQGKAKKLYLEVKSNFSEKDHDTILTLWVKSELSKEGKNNFLSYLDKLISRFSFKS